MRSQSTEPSGAGVRPRLLLAAAIGLAVVAGAALATGAALGAGGWYPWKAAAVFTVVMALAIRFAGEHPFAALGPANHVTMVRVGLAALMAGLIGEPDTREAGWAAASGTMAFVMLDGVDGWLARRTGLASRFGARFDMETDAALALILSILVWRHGKAGAWILIGGLMRYGFGAAASLLPWMSRPLTPTRRGRAMAVGYLAGLGVTLAPIVPWPASAAAAGVILAGLIWSFAVDVVRLGREEHA
jgi:phosphatidylglycerophosphate synthase